MWRRSIDWIRKDSSIWMWWATVIVAVTLNPWVPLQAAESPESFPYTATLATEGTVYAGPSQDFFETDRIPPGTEVEVYRHDGDGWCAIRPPATSFSWIAAEHLEITDNPNLARVINVPVKTRVGSNFSDTLEIEYVSLREGEILELRGSRKLRESPESQVRRWFKIAPPSGEFRWVRASQLAGRRTNADKKDNPSTSPISSDKIEVTGFASVETFELSSDHNDSTQKPSKPALVVVPEHKKLDLAAAPASSYANNSEETGFVEYDAPRGTVTLASHAESVQPQTSWATSDDQGASPNAASPNAGISSPIGTGVRTEEKFKQAPMANHDGLPPAPPSSTALPNSTHVNVMTWEAVSSPTDPNGAPEPRNFVEKYNALNVMLSRAILGDIEGWKLDKLAAQSELLLSQAQKIGEANLAQGLADKVAEFQSLQNRSQQMDVDYIQQAAATEPTVKPLPLPEFNAARLPGTANTQASKQATPASPKPEMPQRIVQRGPRAVRSARELRRSDQIDNSIFDASGTLVAVKSGTSGIPKYALTNKSGGIVKFLSTKDGRSLANFVNKEVGVLGRHGFIRKLQKPHLVADKVVLLQR